MLPSFVVAGGGPENVALIVNADSASSKLIANWYVEGRNIPARNVIYLSGIPNRERMNLKDFRTKILAPLMKQIQERKLSNSIDYIVYSTDFPTAIDLPKADRDKLMELISKQPGGQNIPAKVFGLVGSLNSMTYFASAVLQMSPGYLMLDSNSYYRSPASILLRRPFVGERQSAFQNAAGKLNSESADELQGSIDILLEMAEKNPRQLAVTYWLAKFYAKKGDATSATAWLEKSIRLGWSFKKQTLADLAFEKVMEDSSFNKVAQQIPDQPFDFIPTRGFKSRYAFGPNGMLNAEAGQGNRHFLSCVLGVTRNFGSTEKSTLGNLKISMRADESKPQGTFYFTGTGVRTTTRQPNFASAVTALEGLGQKAVVDKKIFPNNVDDIVGAMIGHATIDFSKENSKINPGAICETLTSYGGVMYRAGHTKVTEFTDQGAAGSSGTVTEPYAIQAKFPHPMIQAHYARGCSLAESFYQSVYGPYQLLIVGDALCQPWATKPTIDVTGLMPGETVSGQVNLKLDVSQSPAPVVGLELYVDGVMVQRAPFKEKVGFDTKTLTDGFHEIRMVVIADGPIETVGHVVFPLFIDNFQKQTSLIVDETKIEVGDDFSIKAKSNFGEKIELRQNHRLIKSKKGREVEFKVSADLLGRGPVKLQAVAVSEKGNEVASEPVELIIEGPLSNDREDTETKKK
ncbi:MAG: hypothetical protein P8J27_13430 [Mariniblastus sp.]|nr:hypothetical protein [Mariniblastus sp.]